MILRSIFLCLIMSVIAATTYAEQLISYKNMIPNPVQPWYFQRPIGVAVSPNGYVYVSETNDDTNWIRKLTLDGTIITTFGGMGQGNGQLYQPYGIALDSGNNVYVCDTFNHRIQVFSEHGVFLRGWGAQGSAAGQFNGPMGIGVNKTTGDVYVADTNNHRIQQFTSNGTFIKEWGEYYNGGYTYSGNYQFNGPRDVAVDSAGNVYVTDHSNHRVMVYTSTGTFIRKWGNESGDGHLYYPLGILVTSTDKVYVTDQDSVKRYTTSGAYETKWGSEGVGDGQFDLPWGLGADTSGNIYVAGSDDHRVQKFNAGGTFLALWGVRSSREGMFNVPWNLNVDQDGKIYVADTYNHRIQIFSADGQFLSVWGERGSDQENFISQRVW